MDGVASWDDICNHPLVKESGFGIFKTCMVTSALSDLLPFSKSFSLQQESVPILRAEPLIHKQYSRFALRSVDLSRRPVLLRSSVFSFCCPGTVSPSPHRDSIDSSCTVYTYVGEKLSSGQNLTSTHWAE